MSACNPPARFAEYAVVLDDILRRWIIRINSILYGVRGAPELLKNVNTHLRDRTGCPTGGGGSSAVQLFSHVFRRERRYSRRYRNSFFGPLGGEACPKVNEFSLSNGSSIFRAHGSNMFCHWRNTEKIRYNTNREPQKFENPKTHTNGGF